MLTTLSAYSSRSNAPTLDLSERGAHTDFIQIRNVEGLGPVKANVNTTPYGSVDGEAYNGSEVPKRNIVITVGFNPDWNEWSVETLERLLYAYFIPKQTVRLVFTSDDDFPVVEITGVCESVDPNMFSKDPEMQISIICPDPYFTTTQPVVITRAEGLPATNVHNIGQLPVGIDLKVTYISGATPSLVMVQVGDPTLGFWSVRGSTPLITPTKYLKLSTIPGNKYVQQVDTSTGVTTNLLANIDIGSTWPELQPGDNDFYVDSSSGVQEWQLSYTPKFAGL